LSFFNPKEDVIEIQLTGYGKRLLAKGQFKPFYYSFNDSGILYDGNYAAISESQNSIQTRIHDETPCLKIQENVIGIETDIKKSSKIKRLQNSNDYEDIQNYNNYSCLGNSELSNQFIPAWNVRFWMGELTGSVTYLTGTVSIPNLSSSIIYRTYIDKTDMPDEGDDILKINNVSEKIYKDGTFVAIEPHDILIEINEKNVEFMKENFEIELYEVKQFYDNKISGSLIKEQLIPLYFNDSQDIFSNVQENNTFVSYYMDVLVDSEIPDEIMCKTVKKELKRNIFSDELKKCDIKEKTKEDIYNLPEGKIEC